MTALFVAPSSFSRCGIFTVEAAASTEVCGHKAATMKLLVVVENKTLCAKFGEIPPFKGS